MIRRPPRSTQSRSSAASDVYKRQVHGNLTLSSANIADCANPVMLLQLNLKKKGDFDAKRVLIELAKEDLDSLIEKLTHVENTLQQSLMRNFCCFERSVARSCIESFLLP
eukprot:TRINITY_DN4156_c0_g1_i3.p1 TRINITY_DN4156_c0_g1~~TRINITY_DN4156_c0_g1_i3.p1  ORF type:complete len:110 (+),score=40.33 TRINITY_DN4156_c0_g1_i3:3-332(+)